MMFYVFRMNEIALWVPPTSSSPDMDTLATGLVLWMTIVWLSYRMWAQSRLLQVANDLDVLCRSIIYLLVWNKTDSPLLAFLLVNSLKKKRLV
jgi:hypothetical protein